MYRFTKYFILCYNSGVDDMRKKIRDGREKTFVAQVQKIHFTSPFSPIVTDHTYFTTHKCFEPASIIDEENVHLLALSNDEATFLRVRADLEIFNIRKNPIFFLAQTMNAKEMITLPRNVYNKMVEQIDISDREVVWLFQTVRCGSTVWAQIFGSLPSFMVISESQVMYHSIAFHSDMLNFQQFTRTKEYEDMVIAMIKSHVNYIPKNKKVFWKTCILDDHMIPIIHKHFPKHKMVFAYRNTLGCATSYERAFGWLPMVKQDCKRLVNAMFEDKPTGSARTMKIFYTNGFDPARCDKAIWRAKLSCSPFEWFVVLWAAKVSTVVQCINQGIDIKPAKYEYLQDDPKQTIREIFRYLGLSDDLLEIACKAMQPDSQAGLVFSQQNRTARGIWQRTEEAVQRCNSILKSFELPDLDSDFVVVPAPDRMK